MIGDRVLVVDDSAPNRLVAMGHLESAGYTVVTASSGEEALGVLDRERVDLVVLDVLMPGLGGFETCRRIRATPAIADTPILFLTALADRDTTLPALEAGGDDLLPKPFHRAELLLRVRALIRQRRTTEGLRDAMRVLATQHEQLRRAELDRRRIDQLIVHDLKGPVTAIAGNAELLREAALGGELAEIVDDILLAAGQLDRTTRDLLDLSRAQDGAFIARLESFDLPELAAEVASALRVLARWTSVTLELAITVERAVADRELVRRILQNLVHNAVQHAPANTAVRIEAVRDGDMLELLVLDEGPGVPAEEAERIFERYVSTAERQRSGGHGLGLVFCRLATEAHGGKVWVENRSPRGAAFRVRLPQPAVR